MWILIWFLLAIFILGFFGWSTLALLNQKSTWRKFASKHDLTYDPGKFLNTAIVTGRLKGLRFNLFSGTEEIEDVRGQRYMTILEFELGSGMRVKGALGSPEMRLFINTLNYQDTFMPEFKGWNEEYIVRTNDAKELANYLTEERAKVLSKVFTMKNSVAILMFDKIECVLRIETSDPLSDPEHLNKVIDSIILVCRKLKPESYSGKDDKK